MILYADRVTDSMEKALRETNRRRELQVAHNIKHNITPQTIVKDTTNRLLESVRGRGESFDDGGKKKSVDIDFDSIARELPKAIKKLEAQMKQAAKMLDYERAAELRDQLKALQELAAKHRQR